MESKENTPPIDRMQSFEEVLPYLKGLQINLPKALANEGRDGDDHRKIAG